MPKTSLHTLIWSQDHAHYEWYTQDHLEQIFSPEDTDAWLTWLATATSFAFRGAAGRLNVYQEARRDAHQYWYAYHTTGKRTRKRYLGRSARVTFAHLEEVASALGQGESGQDTSTLDTMPGMSLLSTNLVPPLLRSELVVRERLLAQLDAACSHRLTLLSASAGWGKTTLLSMWAARSRSPVAWLSLGDLENDPARFWVAVIAALRHSGASSPLVGERALALLRLPELPPLGTILSLLVHDLSVQHTPTFLLLDDYHMIEEQVIHDSVLFLLEHLPAHLHLILASRTDPPLALARWRARGALLELRDANLRFQEDEVGQFLTRTMALALAPTEVALLTQRTEGWIAGLHLAALALSHSQDHASFFHGFSGSHRYLVDYVQEDILAHIEKPLQDFLLSCAILSRLSAAFCQVVTEYADIQTCQQMLEQLERTNLFLVPLDEERRWYRLHDLFREALLARLHATQPELIPVLHQRAANWYEEQNELHEAIAHLLASENFSSAARLMERVAEGVWLQGETQTLYRWIIALPDAVLRDHARLALICALYLINSSALIAEEQKSRVRLQVERIVVRVKDVLRQQDHENRPSEETPILQQRLRLLRAYAAALDAIMASNIERLRASSQAMPPLDSEDEIIWQMLPLSIHFILHYTLLREGGVLVPRLQEVKQRVDQDGNRFAAIKVGQWLALAYELAGQLRQAYQECLAVQALLQQIEGHTILAGYVSVCRVEILYHWNRLEEGYPLVSRIIQDAAAWQQVDLEGAGYRESALYALAIGDLASAHEALQKLEHLLQKEQGAASYVSWLAMFRVRYWLTTGNLAAASDWAARVVFHLENWDPKRKEEFLMLVRVYCAQHQYVQAIEALERFRTYFEQPGDLLAASTFLAVSSIALYHGGESKRARAVLIRLLQMTEPEGFIRLYLDEGEPMRQTLKALLDRSCEQDEDVSPVLAMYISTLLAAFEQEERAMRRETLPPANAREQGSRTPPPARLPSSVSGQTVLLEPLTAQEQRVLHLLAAGRSTQEMAQALVVSRNTVKTHLRNLYSKLRVKSRTQALALARDLQLL